VEQTNFWVQHFQDLVDLSDGQWGYNKVESYAKTSVLITTAAWAFACSFLIFVDAMVYGCYKPAVVKKTEDKDQVIADQATCNVMMSVSVGSVDSFD
jgi:hypothetical protein